MGARVGVELIADVKHDVEAVLREAARTRPDVHYADVRLEVVEARAAAAENGTPKLATDALALGFGVRVLAGARAIAPGYVGVVLGEADAPRLPALLREAITRAARRALANAEGKADTREKFGRLADALADTRLHPVEAHRATVEALYDVDPRTIALGELSRLVTDIARRVAELRGLRHTAVGAHTELRRRLFASTEGALVDEAWALTQGTCGVVAVGGEATESFWDAMGHQRGPEVLFEGADEPLLGFPPLAEFALALGREAGEAAAAPPLPSSDREVVVVTDPHYNTLLAHEIIGHPSELDRALKMETAYAGRSWLLRRLDDHEVGRRVASPLVSAYSDPSLPGFGHYRYDDEGVPGRRVVHIDRGVFAGFMNSRQTSVTFGGAPNGHLTATAADLVPIVRMSTTVFAGGDRDPADLVREVEHGYYFAGHRTPSIAESRENFRISARRVWEIEHGELGRLYRDGGVVGDSRDFLVNVDGVGRDFRLYPIPNCGKGQPMQTKRVGNGGPTLRSRARVTGVSTG